MITYVLSFKVAYPIFEKSIQKWLEFLRLIP